MPNSKKSISPNAQITKLDASFEPRMTVETLQNPPNGAAQNAKAKSQKAILVSRIARLVRKYGLTYDQWRYVSRRVRSRCELKPAKKSTRLPRVLTADEFRRFYRIVDQADDVQHSLMLRLLFYTGVRVSELCNLQVEDVDLENCKIRVNKGKGAKDRYVLFGRAFATTLRTHIAAHPSNRWLFQTRRSTRFSARRVQQVVKQYARLAEVKATPHTFRHQAITWLTKSSGLSDAELQLITGHARRETLAIYQHIAVDGEMSERYQRAVQSVEL
jgi:integrase/recombinase XerD